MMASEAVSSIDEFAASLLNRACEIAQAIAPLNERANLLAVVALSYNQLGQRDRALQLLSLASEAVAAIEDPAVKAKSLGELAGVYWENLGLSDRADALLSEAVTIIQTIENDPDGKAKAIGEVAFRYALAGRNEEAQRVAQLQTDEFQQYALNNFLLGVSAFGYEDDKEPEQVIQAIANFPIANSPLDSFNQTNQLLAMAHKYATSNQPDAALQALAQAVELTQNSNPSNLKAGELVAIASSYSELGYQANAVELLQEALAIARTLSTGEFGERLLLPIAEGFAKAGQPDFARQLMQEMQASQNGSYSNAVAWTEIAVSEVRMSEEDDATIDFSQAIAAAQRIAEPYFRSSAFTEVAWKCLEVGRVEQAVEVLAQAHEAAKLIDSSLEDADSEFSRIAFFYGEAGCFEQALQVFLEMQDGYERDNGLGHFVPRLIEAGQYEQAFQMVEYINQPGEKAEALARMALALDEAGEREQGWAVFSQALETGKTIPDLEHRQSVLENITNWYGATGNDEPLLEQIPTLGDAEVQAKLLTEIANRYSEVAQTDRATEIREQVSQTAEQIEDVEQRAYWLLNRSRDLASTGQFEQARAIAETIEMPVIQVHALLQLAETYIESIEN